MPKNVVFFLYPIFLIKTDCRGVLQNAVSLLSLSLCCSTKPCLSLLLLLLFFCRRVRVVAICFLFLRNMTVGKYGRVAPRRCFPTNCSPALRWRGNCSHAPWHHSYRTGISCGGGQKNQKCEKHTTKPRQSPSLVSAYTGDNRPCGLLVARKNMF